MEQLRLARKMKEADMEKVSGISRKTYYNFKHGSGLIDIYMAEKNIPHLKRRA